MRFPCLYVCATGVHSAPRSQKEASNHLELELQLVVSFLVGSGTWNQVLSKSSQCSKTLSSISNPRFLGEGHENVLLTLYLGQLCQHLILRRHPAHACDRVSQSAEAQRAREEDRNGANEIKGHEQNTPCGPGCVSFSSRGHAIANEPSLICQKDR